MIVLYTVLPALVLVIAFIIVLLYCKSKKNVVKDANQLGESVESHMSSQTIIGNKSGVTKE